jgi:hypothetical protein
VRLNNVNVAIVGRRRAGLQEPDPRQEEPGLLHAVVTHEARTKRAVGETGPAIRSGKLVGRPGCSSRAFPSSRHKLMQPHSSNAEVLHAAKPIFSEGDAPALRLLPAREALKGEISQIAAMLEFIMIAVGRSRSRNDFSSHEGSSEGC